MTEKQDIPTYLRGIEEDGTLVMGVPDLDEDKEALIKIIAQGVALGIMQAMGGQLTKQVIEQHGEKETRV